MTNSAVEGRLTNLRLYEGEDWNVPADYAFEDPGESALMMPTNMQRISGGHLVPHARLRRIGWVDQKGRVWTDQGQLPRDFDGGSLTPLLIDARDG